MRVEARAVGDPDLQRTAGALDLEDQGAVIEPQARERGAGLAGERDQPRPVRRRRPRLEHRRHLPERRGRAERGERVLPGQQAKARERTVGLHLPADGEGRVLVHIRRWREAKPRRRVLGIAFQELPRPCPASRRHGVTRTPPNAAAYQRMLNRKPTA